MKFELKDCKVVSSGSTLTVTHLPTGKEVSKTGTITEDLRLEAMQELSDIIEGKKASPKQLLTE